MSTTRKTVAGAYAEIADLRSDINSIKGDLHSILAHLTGDQPATVAKAAKPKSRKAKAQKAEKAATPEWIVQRGVNSTARKALAAKLRKQGIEPNGAAWVKAKKAAGIK